MMIEIGMRVPKDYFVTKGRGSSFNDDHAGSFHHALRSAGIEMCNILSYSSILPIGSRMIRKPAMLVHGAVLETIMARATLKGPGLAVAGIGLVELFRGGESAGGLVVERTLVLEKDPGEPMDDEGARAHVELECKTSLKELYLNGYENYGLGIPQVITEIEEYNGKELNAQDRHSSAIVALCFVNYTVPIIGEL